MCKKLRDLLNAMVEWSQSLLIQKNEIIPSNPEPAKPSPKAANKYDKQDSRENHASILLNQTVPPF